MRVNLRQPEHVHVKMILMLVAGKKVKFLFPVKFRQNAAEMIAVQISALKIIKYQYMFFELYHKTAVVYKYHFHKRFQPSDAISSCRCYFILPIMAFACR